MFYHIYIGLPGDRQNPSLCHQKGTISQFQENANNAVSIDLRDERHRSHVFLLFIRYRLAIGGASDPQIKKPGKVSERSRSETGLVLKLHRPFHSRNIPALFTVPGIAFEALQRPITGALLKLLCRGE